MTCLSFPVRAIRAVRKEADVPAIEEDIMETDLRSFIPVMGEYILFSLLALTLFFFFLGNSNSCWLFTGKEEASVGKAAIASSELVVRPATGPT